MSAVTFECNAKIVGVTSFLSKKGVPIRSVHLIYNSANERTVGVEAYSAWMFTSSPFFSVPAENLVGCECYVVIVNQQCNIVSIDLDSSSSNKVVSASASDDLQNWEPQGSEFVDSGSQEVQ